MHCTMHELLDIYTVCRDILTLNLEILSNVGLKHSLEALQRIINRERAKVVDQPVWVEEMGVNNGSLDVIDISVVLQGTL